MSFEVKSLYEDLHQMPELGFQEVKTSAYVVEKLKEMGYTNITTGMGKTGVVAVEEGAEPGPCVMLRADMDALPFKVEVKTVSFTLAATTLIRLCSWLLPHC